MLSPLFLLAVSVLHYRQGLLLLLQEIMGCITLLSDFGLQDATIASVKGMLIQKVPELPIIDISHLIEPYHLQQAAYLLASTYPMYPEGTCHLVFTGIFSEPHPRLLLCEEQGHYFLVPDNGILTLTFGRIPEKVWECMVLDKTQRFRNWADMAVMIAQRLTTAKPEALALKPCALTHAPAHWLPIAEGNTVTCHVIHIDRFENVVINITRQQFDEIGQGRPFTIHFMRDENITVLSDHYTDVREGEHLCRFNSAGYLEIAINRGQAASLFGFRLYQERHFIYNTIKIFFE